MAWSDEEPKSRFEELVSFLKSQGHSEERARQIVGNHAAAVAEELDKAELPAGEAQPAGDAQPDEKESSARFEAALADLADELRAEFKKQRGA